MWEHENLPRAGELLHGLAPGLANLPDDELCAAVSGIEQLGRAIDGLRVRAAGELERRSRPMPGDDGLAARHGCRRPAELLEQLALIAGAEAGRRVALGTAVTADARIGALSGAEFPRVARALDDGDIGVDAARTIVQRLRSALRMGSPAPDDVDAAERSLVEASRTTAADLIAIHAAVWREALDPDGAEPRDEQLRRERRFTIGRERDGMTPFSGLADPTSAALLRAAVADRTAPGRRPRFLAHDDTGHATADAAPDGAAVDPRTREQRDFDVLMGLVTAGVRADGETHGPLHSPATVTVTVTARELETGTGIAWLDDVGEPVSARTAAELACDGGIRLAVLGADGEVLRLGRRERYFSAAQRRALALRDGGCIWPGCGAPPSWCHAHHVTEWSRGGATDIDNGALLCAFHHRHVHSRGAGHLRMVDGIPHVWHPPGRDRSGSWRAATRARHRIVVRI